MRCPDIYPWITPLGKGYTMHEAMILIEKDEKIPEEVIKWAESHSVPIEFCPDGPDTDIDELSDIKEGFRYDYVITYSSDISLDYLEIMYCHSHELSAVIGTSARLVIREIAPSDLDRYQELIEAFPDAVSDSTLIGLKKEEFLKRHLAYIKYSYHFSGYGIYGIFLKEGGQMIGIAGADGTDAPTLSYALFKEYQGKSYAYEACRIVLEHMKNNLSVSEIKVNVKKENTGSLHLAKKLGEAFPGLIEINIIS